MMDSTQVHSTSPRLLPPIDVLMTQIHSFSDQNHNLSFESGTIYCNLQNFVNSTSNINVSITELSDQMSSQYSTLKYSLDCSGRSLAVIITKIVSFLSIPAYPSPSPSSTNITLSKTKHFSSGKKISANKVAANTESNESANKVLPIAPSTIQDTSKLSPKGGKGLTAINIPISNATPSKGKHVSPYAALLQRNNRSQCSQKGLTDRVGAPEMIAMYAINTADKYTTTGDLEEYLSKIGESNVGMTSTGINRSVGSRHSHMKGSQGISRIMNNSGGVGVSGCTSNTSFHPEGVEYRPALSPSALFASADDSSMEELQNELSFNEQFSNVISKCNHRSAYTIPIIYDRKMKMQSNTLFEQGTQHTKMYSTSKLYSLPTLNVTKK